MGAECTHSADESFAAGNNCFSFILLFEVHALRSKL